MSLPGDIEKVINSVIQLDEEGYEKLITLDGKTVRILINDLDSPVYLKFTRNGISLMSEYRDKVDVTLRASIITYCSMLLSGQDKNVTTIGNMEITGDVGLAQQLQSIIKSLDIDWEEYISRWVGDYPAHKIGNVFRSAKKYFRDSKKLMGMNISEYLRYEKEMLPDQDEIEEFIAAVDTIRNDIDRLAQRIQRLDHKTG